MTKSTCETDCFWPRCSNHRRCNEYGSCVAKAQAGGATFKSAVPEPVRDAQQTSQSLPPREQVAERLYRDFPQLLEPHREYEGLEWFQLSPRARKPFYAGYDTLTAMMTEQPAAFATRPTRDQIANVILGRMVSFQGYSSPMLADDLADKLVSLISAAQCAPQPSGEREIDPFLEKLLAKWEAHSVMVFGTSKTTDVIAAAIRAAITPLPAVSCAAREALAEKINLAYLLTINAGGPTERHLTSEEFATVLAALSLPAAGGEASKREVEIIERCASEAFFVLASVVISDDGGNQLADHVASAIRALAVVPDSRGSGGQRS
jgi:hypothetical protein